MLRAIEYMTVITCISMCDGLLKEDEQFPDDRDEAEFEELHQLFISNPFIVKEFAEYVN